MGAIPKDPTEFAAMLIGAFIGLIYTVSGWKGSGKDTQLSQDPRIKNLLWAVGGLFAVLMADWQKLFSTSTNIDKGRLFAFYAFSMLLVSALTLFFFCLAIRKEVNSLRKKLDIADLPDPTTAIMNYIHFGYSSHSEHMEKLENSAVVALAEKYRRLSSRVLPVTIAAHANAIERLRKEFSQQFYDTVVDTMLQAMASIVKEWADNNGNLVVNCNLMVAKPYSEKSAADDHELQYRWGDENRYGHILTLTNYADPRG
ncbi:MAG: hypothetical protein HYT99_09185, partial [Candidatus Tectomicrobia bacterium]|nr:hypothetical protein [Candidatus Tectomicrobia bacterium]